MLDVDLYSWVTTETALLTSHQFLIIIFDYLNYALLSSFRFVFEIRLSFPPSFQSYFSAISHIILSMQIPSRSGPFVRSTHNSFRICSVHLSSGPLVCFSRYRDRQWLTFLHFLLPIIHDLGLNTPVELTRVVLKPDSVSHQLLPFVNQSNWSNPIFVRYIYWVNSLPRSQASHVPSIGPQSAQFHPVFDLTLRPSCPLCFAIPLF